MAFKTDSKIPPDAHLLNIGAMKCGTTSLYRFLVQHPQICGAVTKEPEFFSESEGHKKRFESYEDLWDFDAAIFRYTLEASTGYTKYPIEANVARRIYDHGLTPKFIYIVRNPFDRIQSHFNFMHSKRDPELRLGVMDDHLIMVSNYFLQLEQYRTFFRREASWSSISTSCGSIPEWFAGSSATFSICPTRIFRPPFPSKIGHNTLPRSR